MNNYAIALVVFASFGVAGIALRIVGVPVPWLACILPIVGPIAFQLLSMAVAVYCRMWWDCVSESWKKFNR